MIQVKDFFNNKPIIFLIVAILIGATWYFTPDPKSPRVGVSHEIYSACLDLDSQHRLVRLVRGSGLPLRGHSLWCVRARRGDKAHAPRPDESHRQSCQENLAHLCRPCP